VIRAAGIPVLTPHCCRHGFATELLRRGVDVHTVAWLGGWASPAQVLATYGHAIKRRDLTNVLGNGKTSMILKSKTIKVAPSGRIKLRTGKSTGAELTRHCSPSVLGGWVYFIQCGDAIKIGFSMNVGRRFLGLQASNPAKLVFLAAFPGTLNDEFKMQSIFRHHHVRGEWFEAEPVIKYLALRKAGRKTDKKRMSLPKTNTRNQMAELAELTKGE
jgi:hypothetical protein